MKANSGNPRPTSPQFSPVQRALPDSKRELDHREYDRGYETNGKEALRNEIPEETEGPSAGLSDTMESSLKDLTQLDIRAKLRGKAGLKMYPTVPPPALFEATELIEAATLFWGLEKDALTGKSKKPEICWPRLSAAICSDRRGSVTQLSARFSIGITAQLSTLLDSSPL